MTERSLIEIAYDLTANSSIDNQTHYEQGIIDLLNKEKEGYDLVTPLNFYLDCLENAHSALFPYMTEARRHQTLRDLQVTYLLLMANFKYELEHQKRENSKKYQEQLKQCEELIDALAYLEDCKKKNIKPSPEQAYLSREKPMAYMGLIYGQLFAKHMVDLTSTSTSKNIKKKVGGINEKRLYWVWASTNLKTMLALLPDDFFSANQAKELITYPDLYTGTMSWGLYFFRFSLNLSLLLKHTIAGPWMSQEEKDEGFSKRFWTQVDQRKFTLLNDFFWGIANALAFFVLYGKGLAGTSGDALTLALLLFDLMVAVWEFVEKEGKYNEEIIAYEKGIRRLGTEIKELRERTKKIQTEIDDLNKQLAGLQEQKAKEIKLKLFELMREKEEKEKRIIELELQDSALKRAKAKCEREWRYERLTLATNITYAFALTISFFLLAHPFVHAPAATLVAMTLAGAVLCFAFSVIANAFKHGIEVDKTKRSLKDVKSELNERIEAFIKNAPAMDENAKKLMFLEIKKVRIDSEYQEKLLDLKTIQLLHNIFIESLIPPAIFLSLVFPPLAIGATIIAASIGTAFGTSMYIKKKYTPEKEVLKELEQEEYEQFCENPKAWNKKIEKTNAPVFFKAEDQDSYHATTNKAAPAA